MKRIFAILLFAFVVKFAFAQTDTAVRLFNKANSFKNGRQEFLKKDFSKIDSVSMHDLAVLFYNDNDLVSAGACWEIALQKVVKYGKAYEQILQCLSAAYMNIDDQQKIQWLLAVIEDHNKHELTKECHDYKCKLGNAQYYAVHGDDAKAKKLFAESLSLCSSDEELIEVEEAFARYLFDVRDFEGSAQYFLSLSGLRKDSLQIGNDLYWAAQNYLIVQKSTVAEECSRKALKYFEGQKSEEGRKYYLLSLISLGDALYVQLRNSEALESYREGLEGYKSFMPDDEKLGDLYEDVAKVEVRLKMFDDAIKHYQSALDIYKKHEDDSKYYRTHSSLMLCLRKSGDNEGAERMEAEASARHKNECQRLLDEELQTIETTKKFLNSKVYTNSLNTIAACYFDLENYVASAENYALYSENLRNMLRENFLMMTENDRQRLWNEQLDNIENFCFSIAVLPDSNSYMMQGFIPTFYDLELLSKGIMLNSSIEFENVLSSVEDKSLLQTYEQLKELWNQIESLQAVPSDENLQKVLELKRTIVPLENKLMEGCSAVKDYTEYLSYTWKDVQKKLGSSDVAIEFTSVQLSPLDKDTYLLALILNSEGEPQMHVVSTRAFIKNMEQKEDLYDNTGYYKCFWGFLEEYLKGKKRIFFAPNNMLSNIAIEYLKDGDNPFFETHEVYRLSSTKELCRQYSKSSSKTIAIFGDVDYQTSEVAETKSALAFGRLRYSKQEIDTIDLVMKNQYNVEVYNGSKASEQNFFMLSGKPISILHISSHGAYVEDNSSSSDMAMKNSFLALAGVNRIGQSEENDGVVTAADVSQMNLRECDMAVLSACQTGVGDLGEDGVFGLQRGFKNAGVHTLLMSLKSVYDESTAMLMVEFYRGLANELSKREALLKAQIELRKNPKYSKGEYWAPFILLDAYEN